MLRLYFVGAHSTGKTTLARYFSDYFKLPMVSEVARAVLAEMEVSFEALRADLNRVDEYQRKVFMRQVEVEKLQKGSFVSDRAFDNLAYAAEHSTVLSELTTMPMFEEYMLSVAKGAVFFIRPNRALLTADGMREVADWDAVMRIDGMIKFLLEMYAIPYMSLHSSSMQERVKAVHYVLNGIYRGDVAPNGGVHVQSPATFTWSNAAMTESGATIK